MVFDKVEWVVNFYCNMLKFLIDFMVVVGLDYFRDFKLEYIYVCEGLCEIMFVSVVLIWFELNVLF